MAPLLDTQPTETPSKGTTKVVPTLESLDIETATTDEIVDSIRRVGGVVIRNFLPISVIDAIESEVRPHLEADAPWDGNAFPPETRRVTGVLLKSKTFRERIVMHPKYWPVADALLSVKTGAWWGDTFAENTSTPNIGGTVVFSVRPGAQPQPLHRDDMPFHSKLARITADEYEGGRDNAITLFVAGTKTTKANGATRFCPGSHLEASGEAPSEDRAVYAELEKGDAFIMLSSCYHGGSANTTEDEERLVYSMFANKGFLRQGENQYLIIPKEVAATWDDDTLRRVGYATSSPLLGFVDFMDPMVSIKGGPVKRNNFGEEGVAA